MTDDTNSWVSERLQSGQAFFAKGLYLAASECFGEVCRKSPTAAAFFYLGNCLKRLDRIDEASTCFEEALRRDPSLYEASGNLALLMLDQRRYKDASQLLKRLVSEHPNVLPLKVNLANALRGELRFNDALHLLRSLAAEHPGNGKILANLGHLLADMGELDEAELRLRQATALLPDSFQAKLNLSHLLLLKGNYQLGLPEFEIRLQDPRRTRHRFERPNRFERPKWNGENPDGMSILLCAEEGLGDTVMFVRYAALLKERNATVYVECQPSIKQLVSGVPGVSRVFARGETLPTTDVWCPMMSLPLLFGTTRDSIPDNSPYLSVDSQRYKKWKTTIERFKRPRVGICWQCSSAYSANWQRSVNLEDLAILAEARNASFFSLQKDASPQWAKLTFPGLETFDGHLDDDDHAFCDTVAVMKHLDLIISVDTSVAHVAGALCCPTWILIPHAPNWRWLSCGAQSPWYRSAKLFRQHTPGDWTSSIREMVTQLKAMQHTEKDDRS